jgi:hypothetical protein
MEKLSGDELINLIQAVFPKHPGDKRLISSSGSFWLFI